MLECSDLQSVCALPGLTAASPDVTFMHSDLKCWLITATDLCVYVQEGGRYEMGPF